jgi:hypothetical protein
MNNSLEMKSEEYVGLWWLPQAFEQKIMGTLSCSEKGIYLNLLGFFQTSSNLDICDDYQPIILGLSKNGKLMTCYNARRNGYSVQCPGINSVEYRIDSVFIGVHFSSLFIGVHFSSLEDIKFHELIIETNYLSDWVYTKQPSFLKNWNDKCFKDDDDSDSLNCIFNTPKLEAKTPEATISIQPNINRANNAFKKTIEQYAQISIKVIEQELTFVDFFNRYLYPLQNFLSLATNKNNHIVKINAFSYHGRSSNDELDNKVNLINILVPFICKEESKISRDMLFSLKDIEPEFSVYIQKWLNITEEIQHICNIYFGVKYAEQEMYGENVFLNLVQILESYHRIRISQCQDNDEAHQRKLEIIYKTCPSEYLDWLKDKLMFSHEPSLKIRIEGIINKYRQVIKPLVKDENAFITKVKNTRNYYTHYNETLKEKAANGEELFRINQILSYIIQSCFLNELGCTSERCADLMNLNNEYKYAIIAIQKASYKW